MRPILLLMLLAGAAWFAFGTPPSAHAIWRGAGDLLDRRPARRVLVLGNSRTYFHDMPDMIRDIADSAGDPRRYDITMDAQPGGSMETLWGDPAVQSLLHQRWDDVIVQGESRAEYDDELDASFRTYGARLLGAAHPTSGPPWLVVNWNYDARLWAGTDPDGQGRHAYYDATQAAAETLGERTGARLANIGRLWAQVERGHPAIALTEDGNHPTLAGSYLFALLLYRELSGRDVGAVGYRPAALDPATAATLRGSVGDYQAFGR